MQQRVIAIAAVLLLAVAVSVNAFPSEAGTRALFNDWSRQHARSYSSAEFSVKYANFVRNLHFIDAMNKQNLGFTLGLNEFSDMSFDEFKAVYLGYVAFNQVDEADVEVAPVSADAPAIPADVDWRTRGVVTGIKNQGQCGSCWSFSTTGSLEGAHALHTGRLVALSEQNLVDCSTANHGCSGGSMDLAFRYVISNRGIDTEGSYPYTARDGSCHYNHATCGSTLGGYSDVPSRDENALANAVANQPVSVAIDATEALMHYRSGVFYDAGCSQTALNHGVLAVGYAPDHWIVKNSWGPSWGMNGYVFMARNRGNNCGIATAASFPDRNTANNC